MKLDKALHDKIILESKTYTDDQYEELMNENPSLELRYYENDGGESAKLVAIFENGFMPSNWSRKPRGCETKKDGFFVEFNVGEYHNTEIFTEFEEAADYYLRAYNLIQSKQTERM